MYATPDQLRTYLHVDEDDLEDAAVTRPLEMASLDIDDACGGWLTYEDTGLKFATDDETLQPILTDGQLVHLVLATCAQAEYRMTMGDDFNLKEQYAAQSGPGYSTSGTLRKACGRAYSELRKAGLLKLHGKTTNRSGSRYGELPRIN